MFRPLGISCLALAIFACSQHSTQSTPTANTAPVQQDKRALWPQPKSPFNPAETAVVNARVAKLLASMSLEEKVGQMVVAEMGFITPEQAREFSVGAVLEAGGAYLGKNKQAPVSDWVLQTQRFYLASVDKTGGRAGIPILWGTDALHGHNKAFGATIFPHNVGLGATRNGELVRRIGEVTALETLIAGKNWTYAPVVSVVRDDRWGRSYESYSENPALVAELGRQAVLGLQGEVGTTFMQPNRLMATAKHFIGDGGTEDGVDRADNLATEEDLIRIHSPGYVSTLEAGVLSVMASHNSWQGTRLHGHHYLLTTILKEHMGFDGFVVGDWNSHGLIPGCTNSDCAETVNAGVDMIMAPEHWKEFIQSTLAHVKDGRISHARIDDAVSRILRSKIRAGLMESGDPIHRPYSNDTAQFTNPAHHALARQAVRESLVLLKNNQQLLPLNPRQTILIAGEGADSIPQACGGWTISWQGTGLDNKDFPNATSIATGLKQQIQAAGGKALINKDGKFKQKPAVAIVVFGENPYAEWQGDVKTLAYQPRVNSDAKLLESLKAQGIKTVAVFLSGRPMWVNRELNASDAFVAAWLPGTEGAGIADLLLRKKDGSIAYDFKGKLSFSWPAKPDQTANDGDGSTPLFPYGFGLSYASPQADLAVLSTDVGAAGDLINGNTPMFNGRAKAPWVLNIVSADEVQPYQSSTLAGKVITLTEADQHTQGDAVDAQWNGSGPGLLALQTPKASQNTTDLLARKGVVAFDLMVLQKPTAKVEFEMSYAPKSIAHREDFTSQLNAAALNGWRRYRVDMACFAQHKIDFSELNQGFGLVTNGKLQVRLANVVMEPDQAARADIKCP
jgi:beta-glucosidase